MELIRAAAGDPLTVGTEGQGRGRSRVLFEYPQRYAGGEGPTNAHDDHSFAVANVPPSGTDGQGPMTVENVNRREFFAISDFRFHRWSVLWVLVLGVVISHGGAYFHPWQNARHQAFHLRGSGPG